MEAEKKNHINQEFKCKFRLKDRVKILFGREAKITVVTVTKEEPEVISSNIIIKI